MADFFDRDGDRAYTRVCKTETPDILKAWIDFDGAVSRPKAASLPLKYRELIALAVGITTHCVYCIDAHSQKAIDSGVSALVDRSGMSQPLVSQHLRTLRQAGIVTVSRSGREAVYQLADHHIAHVVDDAITHVLEETPENEREQA